MLLSRTCELYSTVLFFSAINRFGRPRRKQKEVFVSFVRGSLVVIIIVMIVDKNTIISEFFELQGLLLKGTVKLRTLKIED